MQLINEHEALGTYWWVEVFDEDIDTSLKGNVIKIISDFQKKYSRFDEDSLVGKLNLEGKLEEPPEEFVDLLETGVSLYKKSNGQFNFLLGKNLEDRGYDKELSFEVTADDGEIPTIDSIEITQNSIKLDLSSGAKVDLGGFGKAYLIKKISEFLVENKVKHHLINGGGDIYATSNNDNPIEVLIRNPLNKKLAIGRIDIKNEAFCGSSILERSWRRKGGDDIFSHIIDPGDSKKLPAGTVYLIHKDVVEADAFATTLSFKFDDKDYMDQMEKRGFQYLIITKSGLIRSKNFPKLR